MRKSGDDIRGSFCPALWGMMTVVLAIVGFIAALWVVMAVVRVFMALGA